MTIVTIAQIILVMLLWAACFPLITAGIEFSPHLTFAALRSILAGLTLTAIAVALRRPLPKALNEWMMIAVVGLGATSLGFLGMFHAAEFVSPGVATVIASTQPLMAAAIAGLVLNEHLNMRGKMGLSIGFLGILVITAPNLFSAGQENYMLGVTYIVLAAIGVTASNVMIKRIAGDVDALMAMGIQLLIGSIPLAIGASIIEQPMTINWSFAFVGILLVLSLAGTALAFWLWFLVLEKTLLNRANSFSFLVPIFGLSMGVLFYNETLGWPQFIGIALTIIGVALVTHRGVAPG